MPENYKGLLLIVKNNKINQLLLSHSLWQLGRCMDLAENGFLAVNLMHARVHFIC
jgi:hypothetical protein